MKFFIGYKCKDCGTVTPEFTRKIKACLDCGGVRFEKGKTYDDKEK